MKNIFITKIGNQRELMDGEKLILGNTVPIVARDMPISLIILVENSAFD